MKVAELERAAELLIEKLDRLQARQQRCPEGHEFVADSPEYVCPWCEVSRWQAEAGRVQAQLAEAAKPVVPEPLRGREGAVRALGLAGDHMHQVVEILRDERGSRRKGDLERALEATRRVVDAAAEQLGGTGRAGPMKQAG